MTRNVKNFILYCLIAWPAFAQQLHADAWNTGGHIKYQITASQYSADNIFALANTATPLDHYFDVRFNANRKIDKWSYKIHYEILGLYGDTVETLASLPALPNLSFVPTDEKRLFNLSQIFGVGNRFVGVHRIDRLVASYTNDQVVMRFGRQAISWGSGLFFNPLDLINPFSPTAISKEYKTGEDMIYGQWLYESGNDLQGIALPRRNASGNIDSQESSYAVKYRGIKNQIGYELLIANHYSEAVIAAGLSADVKGAVIRFDLLNTQLPDGSSAVSGIANASYSWMWGKHNVSGNLEYYRNGVGSSNGDYSDVFNPTSALGKRVARGEIYGLGQDYLAANLSIELTPRLVTTPTVIHNLNDASGMVQALFNYDWKQDIPIVFGFAVPYGTQGSEYGGIDVPLQPGEYYGPGNTIFFQVGYYF